MGNDGSGEAHQEVKDHLEFDAPQTTANWNLSDPSSNPSASYQEQGSTDRNSKVDSTWILDPAGTNTGNGILQADRWRAQNTTRHDTGGAKGNYTFGYQSDTPPSAAALVDSVHEQFDYQYDKTLSIANNLDGSTGYSGSGKTTGSAQGQADFTQHFNSEGTPGTTYDGYTYNFGGDAQKQLSTQQYSTDDHNGINIVQTQPGYNSALWAHREVIADSTSVDGGNTRGTAPAFYINTVTQQTPGLANFPFHGETGGAIVNNPAQWTLPPSTNPTGGAVVGVPISTDLVGVTINGQRGFMHNSPNGLTDFQPFNVNPTTQEVSVLGAGLQGAGRGVANSVRGAVNSAIELGLQAADFVNASAELLTGNALWKGDLSQTMQGLNSGQLGMGQYYTNLGLNTATFGVYGQAKALYDYGTGKINADQASEQVGGIAIGQFASAYAMSKVQAEAGAPAAEACEDGGCFPGGTLVSTVDGFKSIEMIQVGDQVWACNLITNQWHLRTVIRTHQIGDVNGLVKIITPVETIRATTGHPYWVVEGDDLDMRPLPRHIRAATVQGGIVPGRWVDSHDLRPHDVLLLRGRKPTRVVAVELESWSGTAYNFAVDDLHCYAVGKAEFLVHNNCAVLSRDEAIENGLTERDPNYLTRGLHEFEDHHPLMQGKTYSTFWEERGFGRDEVENWTVTLDKDIHRAIEETGWWKDQVLGKIAAEEVRSGSILSHNEVLRIVNTVLGSVLSWGG